MTERYRVAVIGAGLAGLTAAYRLRQGGAQVRVYERTSLVGGRVQTIAKDGFLLDTGAAALASSYKSYLALAGELGILDDLLPTSPLVAIYRRGRLFNLRLAGGGSRNVFTGLLSWRSRLKLSRLAWDVHLAAKRGQLDYADMRKAAPLDTETAAEYAERVLNREIGDYLVDPIIRTMLMANADKISKVELFSGISNIFGAQLLALKGGQGNLPKLLAEQLDVQLRHEVTRITWQRDRLQVDVRGPTHRGREIFEGCVVACPLEAAAQICPGLAGPLRALSLELDYTHAIGVAVGTRIRPSCPAFLVQMPRCEDAEIALMFLDHNKAPDRAPAEKGLVTCHWEAGASSAWFHRSDADIGARTLRTLLKIFPELSSQIDFLHVTRWREALPYSRVGAYKRIGEFNATIDPFSPLQFAGDYMSAAGQNTAVEYGNKAATNLLTAFAKDRPLTARDT